MYLSERPKCHDSGLFDAGYDCFETALGRVAVKPYPSEKIFSGYTWEEARNKCSRDGKDVKAELPAPLSKVEHDLFTTYAEEFLDLVIWLGVNDREVEGEFRNQHGSLHTYFNWADNEPSGGADKDCVKSGTFLWDQWKDALCTEKRYLLCTHILGKDVISINSLGLKSTFKADYWIVLK